FAYDHPKGGFLGAPSLAAERLSIGERVLFHQANGKWVTAPAIINPPGPNGLMLGALTGLPEVTRAFVLLSRGIGWYSFPDTVLLGPSGPLGAGQPQDQ